MDVKGLLKVPVIALSMGNSFSFASDQKADCKLSVEVRSTLLAQEPSRSVKTLAMVAKDGRSSERHRFDLLGTDFQCEVAFAGHHRGTFINCWKSDMSMGVLADRTSINGTNEHSVVNIIAIGHSRGQSKVLFTCQKSN